jgi:aminoglycoside phosphotransferase family enzyme/predicted kinase
MSSDPFAAVAESHISTVFFAGDRAFKILKPIRTGFLDYSSVEKRGEACRRELELNRRIAPDVYLGVSPLYEGHAVADHVITMRRLPSERRLTNLVRGPGRDDAIRKVARAVAAFHEAQPPDEAAALVASADAVAHLWEQNLREMGEFEGVPRAETLVEVASLAARYIAGRHPLFEKRIEQGLARDGHGDLLAEDIFLLDDGPRILDCLAFDDGLRLGDVLLDAAFLAMDLERLAGRDAGTSFLRSYQEFSDEHHPASLAHHYIAYRALVRAKVGLIRAAQGVTEARTSALGYLEMTINHLRAARPRLVLVGGAPGTGKTTTARGLADRTGFALLSSDEQRKDLAGVAHHTHAFAPRDQGIYSSTMSVRTYEELIAHARTLLAMGESVVLDASWSSAAMRQAARTAAAETYADVLELRCVLDPVLAAERIARRLDTEETASDATPALAAELASAVDCWPEATELDTTEPPPQVARVANAVVGTT